MWVKDEDGDYCNIAMYQGIRTIDRGDEYSMPFQVQAFDFDCCHTLLTCKLEEDARNFVDDIMQSLRLRK